MNRRGFLGSILAAGVAPVFVPNAVARGIWMPVREIARIDTGRLWVWPQGGQIKSLIKWQVTCEDVRVPDLWVVPQTIQVVDPDLWRTRGRIAR